MHPKSKSFVDPMLSPDTQSPQHSTPPQPASPELPATNRFQGLPSEILHAVVDKLPNRTLIQLTGVNRDLRELILNGPFLWRELHWDELEEGLLDEEFSYFAEKYFKEGRMLQYVSLDFSNTQLFEHDEMEEIDVMFDYLEEHGCNQVQSFRIMSRYHIPPSTLLMIAVHCPTLVDLQLVRSRYHEDIFEDCITTLPTVIRRFPSLKRLTMTLMGHDDPGDISEDIHSITQHIHLRSLVLQEVTAIRYSRDVLEIVPRLPNLQKLAIGCTNMRSINDHDTLLRHCHQLDSITITEDQFLDYKLFAYDIVHRPNMKSLYLRADADDWETEAMEHVAYIEKHHHELETLVLGNSVFVHPPLIRKLGSLSSFLNLRCLALSGYCLDHHGYADVDALHKELIHFLGGCPNLDQIHFEDMDGVVGDDTLDAIQANGLRSLHLARMANITTNPITRLLKRHQQLDRLREIVIYDMDRVEYTLLPTIGITCNRLKWLHFYPDASGYREASEYVAIDEFLSTHRINGKMDLLKIGTNIYQDSRTWKDRLLCSHDFLQ